MPAHGAGVHLGLEERRWRAATSGPSASVICVAAGGPSRPTSRSSPSNSGWRAARRNTERTTASTRAHPSPAPRERRLERLGEVPALRAITASKRASFEGNQ